MKGSPESRSAQFRGFRFSSLTASCEKTLPVERTATILELGVKTLPNMGQQKAPAESRWKRSLRRSPSFRGRPVTGLAPCSRT